MSLATVDGLDDPVLDVGLFGPDSVTWRVHAEPSLWIGGLRALFLQALHPLAMAGVDQHSVFENDWWGRLYRTGEYVGITTYGTTREAHEIAAHVRRAHRGLKGIEPESGQKYVVGDPKLLLWVHCGQVDSFLTSTRRAGLSLTDAEADRYVAEQAAAGALIGIPERMLPHSVADVAAYFDEVRSELRATEAARRGALRLLVPPMPKKVAALTPARPAWALLAALGFTSLPAWARRMYGLPPLPLADVGATVSSRALAIAVRTLPESLREGPHLRAARERLASAALPD
jgi:uncharacterized protein (DUF2236 family)